MRFKVGHTLQKFIGFARCTSDAPPQDQIDPILLLSSPQPYYNLPVPMNPTWHLILPFKETNINKIHPLVVVRE